MKKLQSLILAILWSTGFAFSASSGTCGDDLTWTLDDDGVLTISGTGDMTNYSKSSSVPWYFYTDYLYNGSSSITSIVIKDDVTSIGSHAFYNCSSLTSIEIPESVTSIGMYAFYGCSSLATIEIPESVTSIGWSAFYNCSSLATIEIPESVTSIGTYAFCGCSSLESITLPGGLTSIGTYTFCYCSSLTSIEIPESVTSIESYAFYKCSSLTSVTSLSSYPPICINADVFSSETYTSASLYVASNLYAYATAWKEFSLIEFTDNAQTLSTTLTGQCGDNLTWTLDLTSLSLVFEGSGEMYDYSSSTLPDYLPYAITTVSLPDGLTSIGNYAFYGSSITSIEIPDGVTSIGSSAFYYSSLTSIELPEGLTSINAGAFSCCSSLESVVIPSGVTSIATTAFEGCTSLTSVTSLATTPPICDSYASFNMTAYDNATLYAASNLYQLALYWKNFSTIEYTEDAQTDLTTISGQCGDNLTWTLNLADSTLTITDSGDMYDYDYGGSPWYHYKEYVTTATLPDELTTVGDYAFMGCSSLTSIEIPESVTSIGAYAFYGCSSLASITLPGVTSISNYTFYNCSSLTSIEIPESVTSIGNLAFYQCTALTSVTSLNSTPPTCGSNVFSSSTYTDATLYAASTDYLTADYWEDFENCVISGNAISDVTVDAATIRAAGSTIVITTPAATTARVVSLAGKVIAQTAIPEGVTSIDIATGGVYIVTLSDGTREKVLVK